MKLIFATNNLHKIDEIKSALRNTSIEVITLKDAGIEIDIPEPYRSLEENATHKSRTIYALTKMNCFSEDTGLEVEALLGEPGVKSARYAGEAKSFEKNIEKLLRNLEGNDNRQAKFRTVISLIIGEKEILFEGSCNGTITYGGKGQNGFGYDPVFVPDGAIHTFAEMNMDEKNRFSHRKKAVDKLVAYLSERQLKQNPRI
jgi:XTP/dITP diphosphohydrolase